MSLTIQSIQQVNDIETKDIEIPEWGGTMCFRLLSGSQRDEYEAFAMMRRKKGVLDPRGLKARLVAMCAIDENGQPFFPNVNEAVALLNSKSGKVVDRLYDELTLFNGFRSETKEEDMLDVLEGNFDGTTSEDSGSRSQSDLEPLSLN